MDKLYTIFNFIDSQLKLEYIGVLFLAFGFGMMLGIVGFVEDLQTRPFNQANSNLCLWQIICWEVLPT